MARHVLAIDQGTTSTRAFFFDAGLAPVAIDQQELPQAFPRPGWVEHAPEDLWATTIATCRRAMARAGLRAGDIAAIGLTNQRETTLVWERATGHPIHPAIVWQDRRTGDACAALKRKGAERMVSERTRLLLDPYFSATKIAWILDHVEGARARAERGELAFGTVDSWLIWRLTGGAHLTDATNAARTLLYDIHAGRWNVELCDLFRVPLAMLPEVRDCAGDFGTVIPEHLGAAIPIMGVAGDQQAAMIGQACFRPGMMKATYGTGCFALLNTGDAPVTSRNRLLTTIGYRLGGETTYALEGSIFVAGAAVQWLRDGLQIVPAASETGGLAAAADPDQAVYLVPAFTGLGAPYWDAGARGAIFGLTRNTGPEELARAALEAVGYQTRDLLEAMRADCAGAPEAGAAGEADPVLRVDGGMSASDWAMQFLADILGAPVDRPAVRETTAKGAAWLAGLQAGLYPDQAGFAKDWARERRFAPSLAPDLREGKYAGWREAVRRCLTG